MKKQPKKNNQCKIESVKIKKINLFEDKKDNYYINHKNEKKMYNKPLTPRTRGSSLIDLECGVCGETFKVNKGFDKNFICNACLLDKK